MAGTAEPARAGETSHAHWPASGTLIARRRLAGSAVPAFAAAWRLPMDGVTQHDDQAGRPRAGRAPGGPAGRRRARRRGAAGLRRRRRPGDRRRGRRGRGGRIRGGRGAGEWLSADDRAAWQGERHEPRRAPHLRPRHAREPGTGGATARADRVRHRGAHRRPRLGDLRHRRHRRLRADPAQRRRPGEGRAAHADPEPDAVPVARSRYAGSAAERLGVRVAERVRGAGSVRVARRERPCIGDPERLGEPIRGCTSAAPSATPSPSPSPAPSPSG